MNLLPLLASWGVTAVLLYSVAAWTGAAWLEVATKPMPVLLMATWAATRQRGRYGRLIAVGLGLGALGDLLLALEGLFLPGLVVFLLAHLLYIAAFTQDCRRVEAGRALPFVAFGAMTFAVLRPELGEMALPVGAYTVVISTMLWRAAARIGTSQRAWVGLLGAGAFAFSDALLAVDLFHTPQEGAGGMVMASYWLGQLGIAATVGRVDEGGPAPPL